MNYYFLPGTGIYGGIKVGYQFADLLNQLGARTVMVTPDGHAPNWFRASAPTICEADAESRITAQDVRLFSLPHDYPRLAARPGRLVLHCQGTDPLINPILADPRVTILTCWPQATAYVRQQAARESIEVGLHLSDSFYYHGQPKGPGTVAYMPRRGNDLVDTLDLTRRGLHPQPIHGLPENEVARRLQRSEYYLATAPREWFGLPALEAMAAGCVVLSLPAVGGMDYLCDGENCRVAEAGQWPAILDELAAPEAASYRARLRDRARVTAARYHLREQTNRVAELLGGELSFLKP